MSRHRYDIATIRADYLRAAFGLALTLGPVLLLDPAPVRGVPEVKVLRRSGLLGIALHPQFAENRFVYLTYHKPLPDDQSALALARARWNGTELLGLRDLFVTEPGSGSVARIVFGPDGTIYMSTAGGEAAQDPNNLLLGQPDGQPAA